MRAPTSAAGIWIDSEFGELSAAQLFSLAEGYGYEESSLTRIANKHLASKAAGKDKITGAEFERLLRNEGSVVEYFNNSIAPEGYFFGWHKNQFLMMPINWWDELDS